MDIDSLRLIETKPRPGNGKQPFRSVAVFLRRAAPHKEPTMWDVIMLAIGLGFFLLSVGYTLACDRL
jgi:hypothetical protein